MGNRVDPAQTSFNAGELSPMWASRVDMAKYGNGCAVMRNMVPVPQGPARRRSGTRHVAATRTETHRSWLAEFIFSEDESYVLEFGNSYIRFYAGDGQVLSAGVPYEIASPYTVADLTNADGTFKLDMEQTGDVIFIADGAHFPQKLSRLGPTNWTISDADIRGGPFETPDPDETITVYASAETGSITLTASSSIFDSATVGTLFLLESKRIDGYAVWEVSKSITLGDERRSDSNVYKALNTATTGAVKPTHREGARFDGDTGVQWEYLHSGYGVAEITSASGTTANATVISRIPSQAVGVSNASTRWAKAAWRSDTGYPSLVTIFRERLCFCRGQQVWGSVSGDFENFSNRDGAETLPDSAFSITIGSSETNACVWMIAADSLLVGTRGAEFSVSEVTTTDVFGPGNIKATQVTSYGSRQVAPVRIGGSTLFCQRSGMRLRDLHPDPNAFAGYVANDLMVLSDHVLRGRLLQMKFALEPHSIAWGCLASGGLVGLTYLLEQDVIGWHPHEVGGGGIVESVAVIPAPDGTHDRVWLQVRRSVNGQTRRYVEYMEKDWHASETALDDAVFSDSASTFDGTLVGETATLQGGVTWAAGEQAQADLSFTPVAGDIGDYLVLVASNGDEARVRVDSATDPADVTFITPVPTSLRNVATGNLKWARNVISGLSYAEGREVTLTVEGAAHPRRTVSDGSITLQAPAAKVQVGFPCDARILTMRVEGGSGVGTAQGKIKRAHQLVVRMHESLGGKAGPSGFEDSFEFRADNDPMDEPPPIFTGDYQIAYPEGYDRGGFIRLLWDQPLPFTICGIYPRFVVEDAL